MTNQIQKATQVLRSGGVVIYPTITVYSLGANIFDKEAIKKVVKLKESSLPNPIPIMVNSFQLAETLAYIGGDMAVLRQLWPGSTTVLLPRKANLSPELVDNQGRVALRFSDNPAREIIQETGFAITALPAFDSNGFLIVQPNKVDRSVDFIVQGICQFADLSTIIDLTERKIIGSGVEVEKVKTILQI